jgi:hypothetical protein
LPFPLLAHQAPVLPLKLWRPAWFSAVALCAGSMAPDVDFAIRPERAHLGHSLVGQFVFCLPITLAATFATARYIAPVFRREALHPLASARAFVIVVTSALIGSFSHLAFDAVTHGRRFGGLWSQIGFSIIGAAVGLVLMLRLLMRPDASVQKATVTWPLWTIPLAFAAAAVVVSRPIVKHASWYFVLAPYYVWGYVLFRAFCAAFIGLTVASLALRGTRVAPS